MTIKINNANDIARMRVACRLAGEVLDYITPFVAVGVSTEELDRLCNEYIVNEQQAVSACLNYQPPGFPPYPKSICISVNDVVCHGIPGSRTLKEGDILNIDVTVIKDGYFGDTSRMFMVGKPSILANRLVQATYESMWMGIATIRPGATFGDLGYAVQTYAQKLGFSVVREYCGHGINTVFHDEPQVLHYGQPGMGPKMQAGMIFTVEPMINAGSRDIRTMPDRWTIKTRDRSLSAQWEHTILVTDTGYEVLTACAGSPPPPHFIVSSEVTDKNELPKTAGI